MKGFNLDFYKPRKTREEDILSVENWYNSCLVLGDFLKSKLRHVKVLSWRIAPTTVIVRESVVWWTEVCGGNCDAGTLDAPLGLLGCITNYPIAPTT